MDRVLDGSAYFVLVVTFTSFMIVPAFMWILGALHRDTDDALMWSLSAWILYMWVIIWSVLRLI